MIWICVMISSLATKCQHFKIRGLQFHYMKWLKKGHLNLKSWHFEASEDIITKFKSQGLYTIKIKYWNASGSGFPPSLIPALQNIGILHHKKANCLNICNRVYVVEWFCLIWAIYARFEKTIADSSQLILTGCCGVEKSPNFCWWSHALKRAFLE